jgi:hypothetical protein
MFQFCPDNYPHNLFVGKDIGMTFRDSRGRIIFIDDSGFDPFFEFIADNDKTVMALSEKDNFEDRKASI